jgi:hypothetical protein
MRRLIFGTIIGILVAIAAVAAAIYYYERPSVLRIAVPRDSDDQAIMAAAAHDFAEDRDGIRLKLVAVESLAEASRALQERAHRSRGRAQRSRDAAERPDRVDHAPGCGRVVRAGGEQSARDRRSARA